MHPLEKDALARKFKGNLNGYILVYKTYICKQVYYAQFSKYIYGSIKV